MPDAEILVARSGSIAQARIIGRATFKVSQEFREFGLRAWASGVQQLVLDFSQCQIMDSTFMGVLAMLAIESRGRGTILLVNASPANRALLDGLGVSRLLRFAAQPVPQVTWESLCRAAAGTAEMGSVAGTVLDAHQTLMDVDPANVPKFRAVVDMLRQDLDQPKKD